MMPSIPARADVVVAGSGAAGLTAALAAATQGADVLLVERAGHLGGTSALSGGRVWIPAGDLSGGDTPAAAAAYLDGIFSHRYRHMTEAFIATAPEMARFVEGHSEHRFVACRRYPDYDPSRPGATLRGRALDMLPLDSRKLDPLARNVLLPPGYLPMSFAEWDTWRYPDHFDWDLLRERERTGVRTGGAALVAALADGAVKAGARILTGVRLAGTGQSGSGQSGPGQSGPGPGSAVVERGGQMTTVAATAVILATGGFDWDRQLRGRWQPAAQRASGAPPSNTGDGLRIAEQAGAITDNMAEGWWMPMMAVPGETLLGEQFYRSLIRERGLPRQIMVNAAGRRFVNEARPYNEIGKALHRESGPVHLIFDETYRATYPMPGVPRDGPVPGWVASGRSIAGLASTIGADSATLAATVRRWNQACATGADRDFGRGEDAYQQFCGDPAVRPNPSLGPLDQAPYYAVEVLAGTIGTKGGPVTDIDGAVLSQDGGTIAGLYAVGNAAAFWTADGYPGPGATLAVGMTMGYRAGRHAAASG
ncbi:MAG: 3-oxosteroid 1-dehydrogenase [Actinomycetia bacterium]|nr:3-oxosteroid 1-dehydrogenase [Actinomycetes bacterium]